VVKYDQHPPRNPPEHLASDRPVPTPLLLDLAVNNTNNPPYLIIIDRYPDTLAVPSDIDADEPLGERDIEPEFVSVNAKRPTPPLRLRSASGDLV
jgi:hypothetical protein